MKKKSKREKFKYQTIITGMLVLLVVITTFGGSYAWFNSQIMKDEYNVFKEENFEISYVANDTGYGDILSLVNQEPLTDAEGVKQNAYRFSVTNVGDSEEYFILKINLDQSIVDEDNCINDLLSTSYIKFKIDNQEPQLLGNLANKDYQIYISQESIMPGSSEIHELRIWIDSNSPASVTSKHFHATVDVETTEKDKMYATYTKGEAVTLLNGDSYHILESSDSNSSKVKLISDYNINANGKQDTSCILSKQIKDKVNEDEIMYYCSTINYKEANSLLYGKFLTTLQQSLLDYETRIDNIEVKLPEVSELTKLLGITNNEELSTDNLTQVVTWLANLNYWTMTNYDDDITYNFTLSTNKNSISIKPFSQKSEYFGLRPVIVIDKENITNSTNH